MTIRPRNPLHTAMRGAGDLALLLAAVAATVRFEPALLAVTLCLLAAAALRMGAVFCASAYDNDGGHGATPAPMAGLDPILPPTPPEDDEASLSRAILESSPVGLLTVDARGNIGQANPAACGMFGYSAEDFAGMPLENLMPERFRGGHFRLYRSAMDSSAERVTTIDRELVGVTRDGKEFPVEVTYRSFQQSGRPLMVAAVSDMSGKYHHVSELQTLIKALQRSNDELDNFAYVASHDLKAPLRVIANASKWLAEDLEPHLTEDTRETLDLLNNRVRRMEQLLSDLLEHSRIGRSEPRSVLVTGSEMRDSVAMLLPPADGFRIDYDQTFEAARMPLLPMRSVLVNLIGNAIKHHDRQDGHIHIALEDAPDRMIICVSDDGPGIAPEYHQKIFGMFQTLRPRDVVEGSGMGLAMVKKHVESLGGKIEVRSASGQGADFRFVWPKYWLSPENAGSQT